MISTKKVRRKFEKSSSNAVESKMLKKLKRKAVRDATW